MQSYWHRLRPSEADKPLLVLCQRDPSGGKGHLGFEQHRRPSLIAREIDEKVRVLHLRAIVEDSDLDLVGRVRSGGYRDALSRTGERGPHVVQFVPIVDRATNVARL